MALRNDAALLHSSQAMIAADGGGRATGVAKVSSRELQTPHAVPDHHSREGEQGKGRGKVGG